MPHATLKLIPGTDTNKTPALNEAAVSYTDLVRFVPDRTGLGLIQKIGGWTRYIAGSFSNSIRSLKAWSDLENNKYLAVGGEGTVGAKVYRVEDSAVLDVTPRTITTNGTSSAYATGNELPALIPGDPVRVATTTVLPATYANGAAGVGATLTQTGTPSALIIDGVTLSNTDRVLVKDQFTIGGVANGIYEVTNSGGIGVPWVLTRDPQFDVWNADEFVYGTNFLVQQGATNANRYYYSNNEAPVTIGTNQISFVNSFGLVTDINSSAVTLYMPVIPSSASYVLFPTIINVGNVNLLGPYDVTTIGPGFLTIDIPELLFPISKIVSDAASPNRNVTVYFSQPHPFAPGQKIYVGGVDDASFDGIFTIGTGVNDVTTYTIKYTQTGVVGATASYGGNVSPKVVLGGLPPRFSSDINSSTIVVRLQNHGYSIGDTFNVFVPTTIAGVTLSGLYTISRVNNDDDFEITANVPANATVSVYENNAQIRVDSIVGVVGADQGDNYLYGGVGIGRYGEGLYGTGEVPLPAIGTAITASDWSFDNWGSILIANPKNGTIYYWQPVGSAVENLGYVPNAPLYNTGSFVAMPQRQIVAYGSSFGTIQDPLLVRWCDLEDFTVWQGTATNQAGSYRIPTGSRIVGALQGPQQGLLWTDLDLWSMQYIGQPFIYGFNKIGANAGLIAQKAAGQMGGVVYWMSQKQFFKLGGNGVEVIPCPVWDQVFQNIFPGVDANGNPYTDRIRCAPNSQFNEITWYFPAHYTNDIDPETGLSLDSQQIGTGEVNAYVKYNVALNQWDYGYQHPDSPSVLVGRTAWIDQSILGPPIGAAANTSVVGQSGGFYVYQHETSNYADGQPMETGFTTGYAAISEGDNMVFIDQVWPDMKWGFVDENKTAEVKITFFVTNYPGDAPIQYGPYTVTQSTQYLSVRMRGRLVAIGVSSTDRDALGNPLPGSFWRIGALRYRFQPDGKY